MVEKTIRTAEKTIKDCQTYILPQSQHSCIIGWMVESLKSNSTLVNNNFEETSLPNISKFPDLGN
jgi:hypothetical protein